MRKVEQRPRAKLRPIMAEAWPLQGVLGPRGPLRDANRCLRTGKNRRVCHEISEYQSRREERWAAMEAGDPAGGPRSRAAPSCSTSTTCAAKDASFQRPPAQARLPG